MSRNREERFMRFVERIPDAGCWLWMGAMGSKRYGKFCFNGAADTDYAHRASWRLFRGSIPNGQHVCHKCDVPLCVNPEHLFLGSRKDNMVDASKKGRTCRGERRENRKLTEQDIREIQTALAQKEYGMQTKLAKKYGVSFQLISQIKKGQNWAWLTGVQTV